MLKKIVLFTVTLAGAIAAFYLFSRDDEPLASPGAVDSREVMLDFVERAGDNQNVSMSGGGNIRFRPGESPRVVIHDQQTGKPKYIFEADEWRPMSDDRFDVRKLRIQSFMPRGEIAYIDADHADVTVFQAGDNRFDPRRGVLTGNVRITIDRTTEAWRAANPDKAARDAHADDLIHIEMESAQFDLDRSELISQGAVVVDSVEARIEDVSDLTVRWDQVDNRLESLKFARGGRMIIRRGADMVDFSLPGVEKDGAAPAREDAAEPGGRVAIAVNQPLKIERATTASPVKVAPLSAKEAAQQIRAQGLRVRTNQPVTLSTPKKIEDTSLARRSVEPVGNAPSNSAASEAPAALRTPEALAADIASLRDEVKSGVIQETENLDAADLLALKKERIHSYRAMFEGSVVVEQRRGEDTVGTLKSDHLEAHFDFGSKQQRIMRGPSANADGDDAKAEGEREPVPAPTESAEPAATPQGKVVIVWNGPFELHPLAMDVKQQTGKRFDVVATGHPVRVTSEQGGATCSQLIFRNESRQVWLSGSGEADAELTVAEGRKLAGREIYFDQVRGLAHIDGAGYMVDRKPLVGREALAAAFANEDETVEVHWTESVDVELGKRALSRRNQRTGGMETKDAEYLRRAWFHGDVRFRRGSELARADEVAATFGPPVTDKEFADYIEHLNLSGGVVLSNEDEFVQAAELDVEMIRTPQGRNIPKRACAEGNVLARQVRSEVRARRMELEIQEIHGVRVAAAGDAEKAAPRLGLKWLDAFGDVDVRDPDHNLKISHADTLKARFGSGEAIETMEIVSPSPDVFAQARVEDVAVHGHRIDVNVAAQSLDVPGPGRAWMVTRQDFGGRTLNKPKPVKATWRDQMQLRLNNDYGVFAGDVRIRMEGFAMNSDKLTIRFADVPPVQQHASQQTSNRFGRLGEFFDGEPKVDWTDRIATSSRRKRPVYVVAEGRAEAMTNTNAPGPNEDTVGRLLSRAHITGDQIVADLEREQMSVPSGGTLLIEDYQFDADSQRPAAAATRGVGGPLMSSVRSDGPSQTLVSWEKSMDFFLDRGLVVFDRDVNMIHCSGQQMVLKDALLDAMGMQSDVTSRLKPGRKATLTCQNLLLEFVTDSKPVQPATGGTVCATDLRKMLWRGAIHLQEGEWSLMGSELQYSKSTETVRLDGGNGVEARDHATRPNDGGFNMWRGDYLIWNRATNQVEAPNARVTSR